MIVAISGASGFIGRSLAQKLRQRDWEIRNISRSDIGEAAGIALEQKIRDSDIVINLAGAPVSRKWTPAYKKEIMESRIRTTTRIVEAINRRENRLKVFISASAIGIYDSTGEHTEASEQFADSFLARVCQEWEKAAMQATATDRRVILRIGVVLGKNGGALAKLERPFRMGFGGRLGSGEQSFSYIHLHDLLEAVLFSIENENLEGVVNAVSPHPSYNWEFTEKLGKIFGQPAFFMVPAFALKVALGEGAQVLLEGQKVLPEKLLKSGFVFRFPTIQNALRDIFS